ncbi:MAG: SDR family oxidoreductase [Acidothermus cellulolyticus]|nr:SDR family oxidoreductase [Acidothermus cellulolyticus]
MSAEGRKDEDFCKQEQFEIGRDLYDLTGKVALVTGGSRGIGRAICIGLATFGADVAVAARNRELGEETARMVRELGRRSIFIPTDVADVEQDRRAVDTTVRELGRLDVLVNNAGVAHTAPAEEVAPEEWDALMAVNLRGLFFMSQAAAKAMIKQGTGGRIINIASIFGIVGSGLGASVYHASKGAVVNLTRALACEWAKYGILVNSIGPGFIVTDMTRAIQEMPVLAELLKKRHALGRFGCPEEIVGATVFLASRASTFVTGENLFVDGGYTAS